MQSDLPKVLHRIGGVTLLEHVVSAAVGVEPYQIAVVHGHGGDRVMAELSHLPVTWVEQTELLGTGHAVMQALPDIPNDCVVVILNGDVPLLQSETISALVDEVDTPHTLALVTVDVDEPTGYGRIIRDSDGAVIGIVEERDATAEQRQVREINTGIMAIPMVSLDKLLAAIRPANAQGEYYLTDVVGQGVREGHPIRSTQAANADDLLGINDRVQLAALERRHQLSKVNELMLAGTTVRDPSRLDIRGQVASGRDVIIDVNVVLEGTVSLGDRVRIGPNCVLRNTVVESDTEILENCVIDGADIGATCRIGPFARLRPETILSEHVHIGNFVEVKKSLIRQGSKVNHLSYVGDTEVGRKVNVGAGTITCNYDGANKHKTIIGDDCFIGSGTELVAPIVVATGTTIAAGSTITKDTKLRSLAVARARQHSIDDWQRPQKKK
jgi:bifunctional UDP-N-acetylglucosamine pyrophosphorylase/glucosamine-1-phosphate N-acetyltransferase